MSSSVDPEVAEIIELYNDSFVVNCFICVIASQSYTKLSNNEQLTSQIDVHIALLLYDYLLTLHQEVRLFWTRKFTGASVLFFVILYLTLFNYDILVSATFASFSDAILSPGQLRSLHTRANGVYTIAVLPVGNRSPYLTLAQTRYGFDLTGANLLTLGCKTSNNATMLQGNILSAVSRSSLILADTLVIGVTVATTWKLGAIRAWQGVGSSLGDLLLNHGAYSPL
ncbi:hypothetical protein C8Q79DRAFT_929578 [Trametes meyenii]|nr:hypothetical protein C8Q79DRAFT_929578 [Trametes meyenii]